MGKLLLLPLLLACAGCKTETRTDSEFKLSGTVGGKPVALWLRGGTDATQSAGIDPSLVQEMVAAAVKGAVPAAGALKIFGMDPETVASGAAAVWGAERVWAARNKRREREQGARHQKTEQRA